jgi:hypothetical protein
MKKILTLIPFFISANGFAAEEAVTKQEQPNNYISIGKSTLTADFGSEEGELDGFGVTYTHLPTNSNWGAGVSFDYASEDTSGIEETAWSFSASLHYRPESASWLTVYPMVGASFYSLEAGYFEYSENGLNYGLGLTATIPSTDIFVDFNYKIHKLSDFDDAGIDVTSTYIGLGYRF